MSKRSGLILAGDIGGTYARFGLFDPLELPGPPVFSVALGSQDFSSLPDALANFVAGVPTFTTSRWSIAVAGPTDGRSGSITNLNWPDHHWGPVSELLDAPGVFLNGFAAAAHAIPYLAEGDQHEVIPGLLVPEGAIVVVGPGSGLGVALIKPIGDDFIVVESEGGHATFAPCTEQQLKLRNWLTRGGKRASNETVLSGPGLYRLFSYLEEREPVVPPARSTTIAAIKQLLVEHPDSDPAPIISRLGISGKDEACRAALDLFCEILGAVAGDYALMAKATGGVYLVGGVIRGIYGYLASNSRFSSSFTNKEPQTVLMSQIPVVAVSSDPGLLGAAIYATKMF